MIGGPETRFRGLGMTLQDAAALADARGAGTGMVLGLPSETASVPAEIFAPAGAMLTAEEVQAALASSAGRCFFAFGNQASAPEVSELGALLDLLIHRSGLGFMAASLAAPLLGRTVYQGHLFQDGKHLGNLHHALGQHLSGRIAIIPHDVIAAGSQAIRRKITACREQGIALALLDAVDPAQCEGVAAALAPQLLLGGAQPEPAAASGRCAILSGALDRQTLYQLGAARGAMPFLQLDFSAPDIAQTALAWAGGQSSDFIISASAPPDQLAKNAPVAGILADIACALAATGVRNFVLTGNDTAAAILGRLGFKNLVAGAAWAGLRWLTAPGYNLLLKPAGFGGRNLFLDGFGPQIRLNEAAECTS
jgi:uncharacterized protein YgbK (DUF1537 family)